MVTVKALVQAVAAASSISVEHLLGNGKMHREARLRQVIAFVIHRKRPEVTFPQLGMALGGRERTTIMHGCDVVRDLLAKGEANTLRQFRLVMRCYIRLQRQEPARREELRKRFEELVCEPAPPVEPAPVHNPYHDEPFWVTNRRNAEAVS